MLNFSIDFGYYPWFVPGEIPSTDLQALPNQLVVTVIPSYYVGNYISWTIPVYWGNCVFNVYSAQSDSQTPTLLNKAPLTSPSYFDTSGVNPSSFNQTFYTVEAILPSGAIARSKATTWANVQNPWVFLRAKEIQRRENLFLTRFFGVKSYFFKKKFFGQRCSRCWNPTVEKVMDDHCTVCYGTGFEGGYWTAIDVNLNYTPVQNNAQYTPTGVEEPVQVQAWTTSVPTIQTFDLIFRIPDAKMFRVVSVQPTELQAVRVRQTLILTEIDKDSIEYQLSNPPSISG